MHEIALAESARPARFVVLGLPMKPYSIGHELLLLHQGNMLLSESEEFAKLPSLDQSEYLRNAVRICCRDWKENQSSMPWQWIWHQRILKANYPGEIKSFLEYRKQGSTFPPSPSEDHYCMANGVNKMEKGRALGSPALAKIYDYVARLPDREIFLHGKTALDFPLGFAQFIYYSKLEEDGAINIENHREHRIRMEESMTMEEFRKAACQD